MRKAFRNNWSRALGRSPIKSAPRIKGSDDDCGGSNVGHYANAPGVYPVSQDSSQRGYRPLMFRDICRMIPQFRWKSMISDAKHLYTSNGQISGAVHQKADFTVGQSWKPIYLGDNEKYRDAFREVMKWWVNTCDMRGVPYTLSANVRIGSIDMDRAGDFFIILVEEDGIPRGQFVEAHRIASPFGERQVASGPYKGRLILNGIVYDDFMRPLGYNLIPLETPNGGMPIVPSYNIIPAHSVIHVGDPRWFSESRFIPSICNGVLEWYDMAEIQSAEKMSVKGLSRTMMMEYNDTGRANPSAAATGMGPAGNLNQKVISEIIDEGLIRYFRANSNNRLEAFSSNRPSPAWNGFMEKLSRDGHTGMGWPVEMYDISKCGSAAVRSVVGQVNRSVHQRQNVLTLGFGGFVLYALGVFIANKQLPWCDDWDNIGFTMPASMTIDLGRDADNRRLDVAMGLRSLQDVLGEEGENDIATVFKERAKTWKLRERIAAEFEVPVEALYNPRVASAASSTAFEPEDDASDPDGPPPAKPSTMDARSKK